MIDENLVFIILVTVFVIFIVNKQPKLVATICLVLILYVLYKRNFTNPREFTTFIQNKVKETFQPCSINNMSYCDVMHIDMMNMYLYIYIAYCPLPIAYCLCFVDVVVS